MNQSGCTSSQAWGGWMVWKDTILPIFRYDLEGVVNICISIYFFLSIYIYIYTQTFPRRNLVLHLNK